MTLNAIHKMNPNTISAMTNGMLIHHRLDEYLVNRSAITPIDILF
jgi:hypothetical protein